MFVLILSISIWSFCSAQYYSLDFSQPATLSQFEALKKSGYNNSALRAFAPIGKGQFDQNVCNNIKIAKEANLISMIYMTPLPKEDPVAQVKIMNDGLKGCNLVFHKFWLQVVRPAEWLEKDMNVAFIKTIISEAITKFHQVVGIYTSPSDWEKITGGINITHISGYDHPLWYFDGNSNSNFNDFVSFGGWRAPIMKQTRQSRTVEGIAANINIYAALFH